jgi:4-hydroxyproline epimerase
MQTIEVIDSHTGGEPTRVIIEGGPDLGTGSLADRLAVFQQRFDHYRAAVAGEPRGSDVWVGALLTPPVETDSAAAVLFFNNVGFLGMCGHGLIGVVRTLSHLGRILPGTHRIETPVGTVTATLCDDASVSVRNVPSYRKAADNTFAVEGLGNVTGDIAWGGNWFFLTDNHGQTLESGNVGHLTRVATAIRTAVNQGGFPEVDHIELFGPPTDPRANSRNFVLCPGLAYDRSPCGTGTSAKIACLAADGKLGENEPWVQESIVGSLFTGSYHREGGHLVPTISGTAFITGQCRLMFDPLDPFVWGIHGSVHPSSDV